MSTQSGRLPIRWLATLAVTALLLGAARPADAQRVDPPSTRTYTPEQIAFLFGELPPLTVPVTTLKVWNGAVTLSPNTYVPGPVFVDWNRKNLEWWFLGSTTASGVAKYQWQVSAYGFPRGTSWTPIPGLGGIGTAFGLEFAIDLDPFAPRPDSWRPRLTPTTFTPSNSIDPVFPIPIPSAQQDRIVNVSRFAGVSLPPFSGASVNAYLAQADPVIAQQLTLFVRIVPLGSDGLPVGPPSNAVRLDFGEPPPSGPQPVPNFTLPTFTYYAYEPVRWYTFDYRCHVVAAQDITSPLTGLVWAKGEHENICDDDDSVLDDIASAFGSFVEFLGDFVDWVSDTYSAAKGELITFAASKIPGCDALCKTAIEVGVNAGLAAVGMPPDLPNVKQLQAMGEGYLADTIVAAAEKQTGVPMPEAVKEEVRQAVHDMIDEAAEIATGSGGSSLWIPDMSRQFQAPIITIELQNHAQLPTQPAYVTLSDLDGDRYYATSFFAPSQQPVDTLRIALTMTPKDDPEAWMDLLPTGGDTIFEFAAKSEAAESALVAWAAKYRAGNLRIGSTIKSVLSTASGPSLTCTADPTIAGTCVVSQ